MNEWHMWSRRAFLKAFAGALGAAALTACAPKAQPTPEAKKEEPTKAAEPAPKQEPTKAAPKEKVALKYTSWGNETRLDADKQNIDAFNEKNPDIDVEFIGIARDYTTQILTMIAAGDSPDVMRLNAWDSHAFFAKGTCLAIDEYFASEGVKPEEIYVEPYVQCIYKGKWYGVPRGGTGVQVFFYNKEMFDKAGVPYPTKQDWTWDDFLETAKALTKTTADGKTEQYGFDFWCFGAQESYSTAIWGNGGRVLNEDKTKCTIAEPEAVEAIQWWADLRCVHKVAPTPGEIPEGMGNPFFAGLAAMCQCGAWAINTLRPTEFDWGIVSWPKGPKAHVAGSKPNTCSVGSATKAPDASWKLLWYLGGEEVAKRDAENGLWAPNLKDLMYSDWYRKSDQKPYDLSPTVCGLYCEVRGIPLTTKAAAIRDAISQELQLVFNCEEPAESALKRAAEAVDQVLADIEA